MSTNDRKRKYRGTARHHNSHSFSKPQQHVEPFLSHHEAYLNQNQSSSSSSWGADHASAYRHGGLGVSHGESNSSAQPEPDPLQALYIQAHEADIVRGPSAKIAAQSLEVVEHHVVPLPPGTAVPESGSAAPVVVTPRIGSALIELGSGGGQRSAQAESKYPGAAGGGVHSGLVVVDDDNDYVNSSASLPEQSSSSIWVDRYDIRLLLDTLRPFSSLSHDNLPPASPTGFSDLPSDAEDTFFFSPAEAEEFKREKRRRVMERMRDERVKARMQEEGDNDGDGNSKEEEDVWGGSDEEPDETQKALMHRTATHLASSPNAAQLEMRILANYGADKRFAFLRGRWKHAWGLAKAKARIELNKKEEDKDKKPAAMVVSALAGYGSDSEQDEDEAKEPPVHQTEVDEAMGSDVPPVPSDAPPASGPPPTSAPPTDPDASRPGQPKDMGTDTDVNAEEQAKEARRKRLKAWSEQRRAGAGA